MLWDRLESVEILAHTYDFKNNMICIMTEGQQGLRGMTIYERLRITVLFRSNIGTEIRSRGILKTKLLQSIRIMNAMRTA